MEDGIFDEILSWSGAQPAWQRDALRRLFAKGGLDPPDLDDLTDLCKAAHGLSPALSVNMGETVTPWKFSVEGESGSESDERIGAGPRWAGDRGGGEGDAAAVHARVQAEDRPGSGRL